MRALRIYGNAPVVAEVPLGDEGCCCCFFRLLREVLFRWLYGCVYKSSESFKHAQLILAYTASARMSDYLYTHP